MKSYSLCIKNCGKNTDHKSGMCITCRKITCAKCGNKYTLNGRTTKTKYCNRCIASTGIFTSKVYEL